MIIGLLREPVLGLVLALAPASVGASAPRPPVALTAAPARVSLAGSTSAAVRVTNGGTSPVVVDVTRAGFALDLRGRPRILPHTGARSAAPWLTLRPSRFALGPHGTAALVVASNVPRRAEPGDHDALALFTTRPVGAGRVAVRVRMGVTVVVRVPGAVVRRLELRGLRLARRRRALELLVANRGNVTESIHGARVLLAQARTGRRVAMLAASRREVRPHTRGIVEFRYRGHARGRLTARVLVPADRGRRAVSRTYRIRL
jgi:hypothetical protein